MQIDAVATNAKLAEVATLFGAGWSFEPDMDISGGRLIGPDAALFATFNRYHIASGKIHISGSYGNLESHLRHISSKWEGNNFVTPSRGDSINVSADKSAEQIARDINRRLLPVVIDETRQAIERRDATNNAERNRAASIRRVADALNASVRHPRNGSSDYPEVSYHTVGNLKTYATTNYGGDRIEMKVAGLTIEQAEYLARVLVGMPDTTPALAPTLGGTDA